MDKLVPLPLMEVQQAKLVACHFSDLHVTTKGCLSVEGHRHGLANLSSAIRQIIQLKPDYFFITGDLTDSGQTEEWNSVMTELAILKNENTKIFVIPGNHDLNSVYAQDLGAGPRGLFQRFITYASILNGNVETYCGKRLGSLLEEFETDLAKQNLKKEAAHRREIAIRHTVYRPTIGEGIPGRELQATFRRDAAISYVMQNDWEKTIRDGIRDEFLDSGRSNWFPLIFRDEPRLSCVLMMNSVPLSFSLGEGALGAWGDSQLARLKEILVHLSDVRFLWVLTHHAPFRRWADEAVTWRECADFALLSHQVEEARQFTTLLNEFAVRNPSAQVHVLCGHRHKRDAGLCGTVKVLESDALTGNERAGWLFFAEADRTYVLQR